MCSTAEQQLLPAPVEDDFSLEELVPGHQRFEVGRDQLEEQVEDDGPRFGAWPRSLLNLHEDLRTVPAYNLGSIFNGPAQIRILRIRQLSILVHLAD